MLKDVRVLDLSRILSGPFCSRMLADMGAEVIKVESAGGDAMRYYPPFKGKYSSYFTQWNTGKKSVCINLKKKEGIDIVKRLAARCDVVLQNFRTGLLERIGLGYDVLEKINPRIILCSISGFGQSGSETKRLAYTDIVQAYSGLDYIAGKMRGEDADPPGFPVSFADTYASLNACISILAALYHRQLTGRGQSIDISMLDCLLASNDSTLQQHIFSDGLWDKPIGIWRPPLRMKDGHMGVALLLKFEKTVRAIGRPDLLEDERFNSMAAQVVNIDAFLEIMGKWAKDVTVAEAAAIFEEYDIPWAKVNSNHEILSSQVVKDRQMLVDVELPDVGKVPVINTPFKFSDFATGPTGPPPNLG
ncbi:MAG: CoA transferase, partial [Desulfobacteraceae bacterium]|nr:CoA transferase [Desulfobacteraceae bacterium]